MFCSNIHTHSSMVCHMSVKLHSHQRSWYLNKDSLYHSHHETHYTKTYRKFETLINQSMETNWIPGSDMKIFKLPRASYFMMTSHQLINNYKQDGMAICAGGNIEQIYSTC